MGYATVSDVEALNSLRVFSATSKPTASSVGRMLENTSVELDALLRGQGYALPIATTSTDAITLLRKWNAEGAWALVERSSPQSPHAETAMKAWEATKKMLRVGDVQIDAARNTDVVLPRTPDVCPTPMFTLDQEF